MNPADFLLDLANGVGPDETEDQASVKEKLVAAYKNSTTNKVKEELKEEEDDDDKSRVLDGKDASKVKGEWPMTWFQQFSVLLKRGLKERRHQSFDVLKIGEVLIVALFAGLLWWQSKIGLLYFTSGFWGFFPIYESIFVFPPERMILAKERSSGMYRLSSYFVARTVGDLPMELILPTLFVMVTFWMAGLEPTITSFLHYLFPLLLSIMVAQGIRLALGALTMDLKSATMLGSVIMHVCLLVGGFYVQHIPPFISWIKYFSICNYIYKMMLGSQYKEGDTYPCGDGPTCLVSEFPSIKNVGLGGQLTSAIALLVMFVGYRLIAYVAAYEDQCDEK